MLAATAVVCAVTVVGLGLMTARAVAAPVRGTVALPSELRTGRRHFGYWRVENGNVPIIPPLLRGQTAVVVEGFKGAAPPARTISVEIGGLQASPPLVVAGPGSVIELRNNDKVAHELGLADKPALMPAQRLAPGAMRRQRFVEPGGYRITCSEYPHIAISVVVVGSPHFALVEDKGVFRIADLPDGKGTLKVWSNGRWVHEEPLEVSGKPVDRTVKVTGGAGREPGE
jgi:plastocyanin